MRLTWLLTLLLFLVAFNVIEATKGRKDGKQRENKDKKDRKKSRKLKEHSYFSHIVDVKNPSPNQVLKVLPHPADEYAIFLDGTGVECPDRKAFQKYLKENSPPPLTFEDEMKEARIAAIEARLYKMRKDKDSGNRRRKKRDLVIMDQDRRWDKGIIPYTFKENNCTDEYKREIRYAMGVFEAFTMIRFLFYDQQVTNFFSYNNLNHSNYIEFKCDSALHLDACTTHIGMFVQGKNSYDCCIDQGVDFCLHELGHVVGLADEIRSYLRDKYLRINMDEIIDSFKYPYCYVCTLSPDSYSASLYDLNSPMHYDLGVINKNILQEFDLYDIEEMYLIHSASNYFYFMQAIQEAYNSQEGGCQGESPCYNRGYVSKVDGSCKCRCVKGLDSDSRCNTLESTVTSGLTLQWPLQSFALYKADTGCPAGFHADGRVQRLLSDIKSFWVSEKYYLSPTEPLSEGCFGMTVFENNFCVRDTNETTNTTDIMPEFPKGAYCIYLVGDTCPQGFEMGTISFDEGEIEFFGTLPGWVESYFSKTCCRNDGYHGTPIDLPSGTPFILLPETNACQEVKGMAASWQYYFYPGFGSITSSGHTPYFATDGSIAEIFFCYYRPISYDCGEIITLDANTPTWTFQSPNYPNNYNTDERCTWYIKTNVPGAQIVLEFTDFDISADVLTGFQDDYVEISTFEPGYSGVRYYGKNLDRSKVSKRDAMVVYLYSNRETTAAGFSANVSLLADRCYPGSGENGTYDGTVNYTRSGRQCKYWRDMPHCAHSPYNNKNLKDDLVENYCRNPGSRGEPWCYVDDLCTMDFCDVCHVRRCIDEYGDCGERTREIEFCKDHGKDCQQTCQFCDECYTGDASTYTGDVYYTAGGHTCRPWTDYGPHYNPYNSLEDYPDTSGGSAGRFCRGIDSNSTWCFTTDDNVATDVCDIPVCNADGTRSGACSATDAATDCQAHQNSYPDICETDKLKCASTCNLCSQRQRIDNSTTCQPFSSNYSFTPQKTEYLLGEEVTVNCLGHEQKVTCSSSGQWKPDLRLSACGVCGEGGVLMKDICYYRSTVKMTHSAAVEYCNSTGRQLAIIDSQTKTTALQELLAIYPKAHWISLNDKVTEGTFVWGDGTNATYFNWDPIREPDSSKGCFAENSPFHVSYYDGVWSKTLSGTPCVNWVGKKGQTNKYFRMDDGDVTSASNFCRDPDRKGMPWCYTSDTSSSWEKCAIRHCHKNNHTRLGCRDPSKISSDYWNGYTAHWGVDIYGRICQNWTSDTPGAWVPGYASWYENKFPDPSLDAAGNACRAPDEPDPWCGVNGSWEYCGVPDCTDDNDCSDISFHYRGSVSRTFSGATCQPWNQTEYANFFDLTNETAAEASNFCRDPDERGYLWCVTTNDSEDECDVAKCAEDVEDCVMVMMNGFWADTYCEETKVYALCQEPADLSLLECADHYPVHCLNEVESNPEACSEDSYSNFRNLKCPRTCGRCSDSDPTQPSTETCVEETTGTEVLVGQTYSYPDCQAGFTLASGHLKRACLPGGNMTGQPPDCQPIESLNTWNNNIPITEREHLQGQHIVYLADPDVNINMAIGKAGNVQAWRLYSYTNGVLVLLVLRKISDTEYRVIHQTVVYQSGATRSRLIEVDPENRTEVQANDTIGFMHSLGFDYPGINSHGGIPWDSCNSDIESGAGGWGYSMYYRSIQDNEDSIISQQGFPIYSIGSCRILSLAVMVGP